MEHVVRGSIIQSRAAHYHTSAAHHNVTAAMLRQFAAAAVTSEHGHDYMQPCTSLPASAAKLPLLADLPQHQLPAAVANPMQTSQDLPQHVSQGPHVAWAELPIQGAAEQATTAAGHSHMPAAFPVPATACLGQVDASPQSSMIATATRDNLLIQTARADESVQQHSYQTAIAQYRQQMEVSLEALRQEMEAFQSEILGQSISMTNQHVE